MKKVKVIDAKGVTLQGPIRVKLTKQQWDRREAVLGRWERGGIANLDGGQSLSFKRGEVLSVEPAEGRVDLTQLEPVGWSPEAEVKTDRDSDPAPERIAAIRDALAALPDHAETTAEGVPTVEAVNAAMPQGSDPVTAEERDAAWAARATASEGPTE